MSKGKPKAPAGLGTRGRRFWSDTVATFELERDELELLAEVCRTLDEIEQLREAVSVHGAVTEGSRGQVRTHPALGELRMARSTLARLLAQLALPDEQGQAPESFNTARARKAANVRWALERERNGAA